ncbi:MAG: SDR family NAD(P)-dependent oxidoreductase [Chloroflexi bacterium]|nr:SDR family NAD(P)-dependent oxidoreductase [Chloroflexota bacterium]MDA1227141.1 SDR family NAD(P)-dependent oxidoreductase [Chloroflexota bacterium]
MAENGKVAIVTGAGSGVGKFSALALYKAGYSIALAGRRTEPLQETITEAGDDGSRMLAMSTDVGDPESVATLFSKTLEAFGGRLDLLFNNAGSGAPAIPMEDLTFDQWNNVVRANLHGTFLCTQQAMRIMKNQDPMGGRIINNGSISAHTPRPNSSPYTATKHGVEGLTKCTALDGRKYNICCSQIDIGNAGTPMTAKMGTGVMQPYGEMMIEPTFNVQHVADAVAYIAGLPLDTNVLTMTIMANQMPYVGRG